MPSTYTSRLRLTLPATGELTNVWGNTVNNGITELVEASIAGSATLSTWGGTGVDYTLSNNNGVADEARCMFLVASGAPGENKNIICPAVTKLYVVRNNVSGGFSVTLKTSAGTGITVPNGTTMFLRCDGTNVVDALTRVDNFQAATLGVSGNLTFSGTAQRILGDFSNATVANRVAFQTSTTNGVTSVGAIPNGTATTASYRVFNGTDTANSANATLQISSAEASIASGITGTGTYLPMTFFTGGNERVRVDTSGRVAINTASANTNAFLTVNGSIAAANPTRNAAVSSSVGVWTSDDPVSNDRASITFATTAGGSSSNSYIAFSTNNYGVSGGERMRIDASGNVGIGTTSPGERFNVNSTGAEYAIQWNSTGSNNWVLASATNRAYIANKSTPAEVLTILNGGNVGIGTASPSQLVEASLSQNGKTQVKVTNVNAGANTSAGVLFGTSSGDNGYIGANGGAASSALGGANAVQVTNLTANPLVLATNNTERMRIDASGNVGIGGTSGGNRLEVYSANALVGSFGTAGYGAFYARGSGTSEAYIFLGNVTSGEQGRITSVNGGDLVFSNTAAATERFRITSTGGITSANLADAVGYKGTPLNEQSTAYTLVIGDMGKSIVHPASDNNARTFTIPANGSVAYPVGTTITFINMINTLTISINTDTMYLAGAGTTGSRTLAAYGMATAVKMTSTTWIISGNGLT
jgi:hypothetical protein